MERPPGIPSPLADAVLTAVIAGILAALLLTLFALPSHAATRTVISASEIRATVPSGTTAGSIAVTTTRDVVS